MIEQNPLVSVIIPTYNRAEFILQAVDSVLVQDYSPIEIIVVDDGSTDDSAALLQPYIDNQQIIYRYQENQRQCVARNHAMSLATGKFWCFLDSDNRWLPGKIKAQVEYLLQHPQVDIVYGDNQIIDEAGDITSEHNMRRYSGRIYPQMLRDNCVSMNTVMARSHCFDQQGYFDPAFKVADDYELWLRLSAHYQFAYIPTFFAQYRVMADQISSDKERRFSSNELALKKFFNGNPDLLSTAKKNACFAHFYSRWARLRMAKGDYSGAASMLRRALGFQWYHSGTWRVVLKWVTRS